MFRTGKWAAAVALVGASVWAGFALTAQEPKPVAGAQPADLTALREAVAAAAKRGENVDEVRKALAALEKALASAKPGAAPPELRALRDAVEAAAKKGENVDAVQKELAAVETAVAGRSFQPPKPVPVPQPPMPNQFNPPPLPVPQLFPPDNLDLPLPGRVDLEAFQKANDLRMKALELMSKNPNDPEALKLVTEANNLMFKAVLPNGGAGGLMVPDIARFPDLNRVPERARLGIRFEKLAPVTAEQLGLDPDVGVAVAAVVPGSVAERAGLKVHDIVIEFAGKPVSGGPDEFTRQVNAAKAGEKLDIVVMRKGKKVDIKGVVLADAGRPAVAPRAPAVPLRPDATVIPDVPPRAKPVPIPVPAVPQVAPIPEKTVPEKAIPEKVIDENVRAEILEEAKPDLSDLRDAVAAAAKKGENVDEVRKALAALEKALAKGAGKKDEAPPELTALRDAVEAAVKKGENVGAIAKELCAVEKVLTGRAFERPALEEPRTDVMPEFPRRPGAGFGRPAGGFGGNGGFGRPMLDGFNALSVTVSNGDFVVRARLNDVAYTVTGTKDVAAAPKVVIKDGDKTIETDDLKKVPEAYRPNVEKLLKMVNR